MKWKMGYNILDIGQNILVEWGKCLSFRSNQAIYLYAVTLPTI